MVSKFKLHNHPWCHVLLGLEAIQSTCACAHIIFASFTPLKSIHHLLHASTDLSSLLLLMCVPREALDGVVHFVSHGYGVPPSQDLFKGRYKNACRQDHQEVLSGFATHSRCCLRSLLEIRVKMYESLKPYARNTTSRIRGCESERKKLNALGLEATRDKQQLRHKRSRQAAAANYTARRHIRLRLRDDTKRQWLQPKPVVLECIIIVNCN